MRRALTVAAGAVDSADVPVGAVVVSPPARCWLGRQRAGGRRRPDRARRAAGPAGGRGARSARGGWTAARWWSPWSRAPCAPARWCWPGSPGWSSARADPKAGAVGSLWDVVRDRRLNSRPEVFGGVLAAESADLLRTFFAARRGRLRPLTSRTLPRGGVA